MEKGFSFSFSSFRFNKQKLEELLQGQQQQQIKEDELEENKVQITISETYINYGRNNKKFKRFLKSQRLFPAAKATKHSQMTVRPFVCSFFPLFDCHQNIPAFIFHISSSYFFLQHSSFILHFANSKLFSLFVRNYSSNLKKKKFTEQHNQQQAAYAICTYQTQPISAKKDLTIYLLAISSPKNNGGYC